MIYKKCVMTIANNTAKLDEDIYLYRLDKNIDLYFTIVNNKYKFNKSDMNNIITLTNAAYFQVRLYKNAQVKYIFAIQPTDNGEAILRITDDLIDEPIEVGDYDFQISLLDEEKQSMVSMPIVSKQLHVCEPLVSEDALMGEAILGLSTVGEGEIKNAFDENGNYIREIHVNGQVITAELFNKWEETLEENTNSLKELSSKVWDIQNPFNISSLSITPNVAQMGSTINATLTWVYTHTTIKSQTINNEVVENGLREKTFTGVNTTTTYTLVATSNSDTQKTKNTTISFANGVYYGKSNTSTYDSTLIGGLTKELSNNKNRTITVNAGEGEYIFYCVPSRLGDCSFNVGGFDGGFSKVATVNYANSNNYSENYDIYKSDNANLGNTTITIK